MRTSNLRLNLLLASLALACQTRTQVGTPTTSPDAAPPTDESRDSDGGANGELDAGGEDGGPARDAGSTDTTTDGSSRNPTADAGESQPGVDEDAGVPDGSEQVRYEINTWGHFSALATPQGELKFLLPTDPDAAHTCWFQDTVRYPYHLQFLRSLPAFTNLSAEAYEDMVLTRDSRQFHAGVLRLFSATKHPKSGETGILTYTVYTASTPSELLTPAELGELTRRLESCTGSLAPYLVYLPESNLALAAAEQKAAELAAAGVSWIRPSQLQGPVDASVYSTGEAYGYVRKVTSAEINDVGPRDVVVTSAAPGEIGLVAALVTEQVQSSVSHLNLRLREKRIPNAAAPQLFASGLIDSLEGSLVHVKTTDAGLTITPARRSDAEAFWEAQVPALPAPQYTLAVTTPAPLVALTYADFPAFGTKAANLGELRRALPEVNVPNGLALPFSSYAHHIEHNALQQEIDRAVASAAGSSLATANSILSALRKTLQRAELDPQWEAELLSALETQFGDAALTTRLRFRSSTNVEDLPGLSGAGLYDSSSGCYADDLDADDVGPSHCLTAEHRLYYEGELARLRAKRQEIPDSPKLDALIADVEKELSEEKSARRALRKVWASLWNARAFQDREYYRIDHRHVFMGVAVHPSMVGEKLESVLVSNLEPDSAQPLYRVESQAGEVGVVSPEEPGVVSERLQFRRAFDSTPVEVSLITPSSFSTDGQSLWSTVELNQLATLVFNVQDHFETNVYPDISPLQLDVEVDVTSDGTIVVKQARPYVSGGW